MVDQKHKISLVKQCRALEISRSECLLRTKTGEKRESGVEEDN